ncbi:hypothetical protein AArcSl_0402 [Halalkaliarchaeum desulfuricum]|uniref:DUF2795 domain-containing protein n=1 Tax=Halalkaliarchaeum desulfuricum TaxID=2055893 RepID=A0A343TG33_9EURY|nr:hypothetical protein [Halalkaliarchaeum desulfuricum]AUX08055.1 hypothetical protein AArcSl_0402 [Halalkaliarchaeum desulfuricum]
MRLPQTRDLFIREFDFPAHRDTVIEGVGDVELDAMYGDPETIAEVLSRTDQAEFDSVDELYDALITFVGEQYIGRKFYDDRGMNPETDEEVSF